MMDLHEALAAAVAGRYELEREIGRGGMAVVYLARDLKHSRQVAIKVLPPELATTLGAERFLREIGTAARLSHPNILALHDSIATGDVLCYVMPYVEGESLRQRLDRETQLPVDEALAIARQIAAALDYAHAHGIVHRDIKPENVLLVGDQAVVADFGLARALHSASSAPLTATGIVVGTPAYMSPEQGAGDRVDGRADVYALACVLFEMIAGLPPFRGASAQALLAAHAMRPPPSLCAERKTCPSALDAAVQRALAKLPADRFRTAGEMMRAIDSGSVPVGWTPVAPSGAPGTPARRQAWRWVAGAVAVVAVLGTGIALVRHASAHDAMLDPSRYMVLPFAVADGGPPARDGVAAATRLADALREWSDVTLVDPVRIGAAAASNPLASDEAFAVPRSMAVGRVALGSVSLAGDSETVRATLYDVATGAALRTRTVTYATSPNADLVQAYRELANGLLRDRTELPWRSSADREPASLAAWRAYDAGRAALDRWEMSSAEKNFRDAVGLDPRHPQAQLWLAQTKAWAYPGQPDLWRESAGRAERLIGRLTRNDSLLARGVAALAAERFPDACKSFRALRDLAPDSDIPWYGIAQCLGDDAIVVPDAQSPSGWSFRGSTHSATAAYDSAIARANGAPTFAFRALDGLLITETLATRRGRTPPPNVQTFYAYPAWQADTLAFVPYPARDLELGLARPDRSTFAAALRRDVERLEGEFTEWVRRAPTSAEARERLARVEEIRGERSDIEGGDLKALRTIDEARRLSADPRQQIALTVSRVRLLTKDGRFVDARVLAESLLAAVPKADGDQASQLVGIAALIGNADRTAQLLRVEAAADPTTVFLGPTSPPGPVMDAATAYLAYAALGVCADTLRRLDASVERLLQQYVPDDVREGVRSAVLARSLSLAVPCLGAGALANVHASYPLVRMQRAFATRDFVLLRAQLDTLRHGRIGVRPGDIALDHTYQEAWLLAAMGDSAAAARYLDLSLTALPSLNTHLLDDVAAAAALGRSMMLRADLAAARGDRSSARRWAANVVALWSEASPVMQPMLDRMKRLASS